MAETSPPTSPPAKKADAAPGYSYTELGAQQRLEILVSRIRMLESQLFSQELSRDEQTGAPFMDEDARAAQAAAAKAQIDATVASLVGYAAQRAALEAEVAVAPPA